MHLKEIYTYGLKRAPVPPYLLGQQHYRDLGRVGSGTDWTRDGCGPAP